MSRRGFLGITGVGVGALAVGLPILIPSRAEAGAPRGEDLFSLGVASGDPLPTAVVIWTRLAPVPLDPAGGMNDRSVVVNWQVATAVPRPVGGWIRVPLPLTGRGLEFRAGTGLQSLPPDDCPYDGTQRLVSRQHPEPSSSLKVQGAVLCAQEVATSKTFPSTSASVVQPSWSATRVAPRPTARSMAT
ncbi:PhoD-like phosphatase N-terminal domain-containing protein [Actinopolymorpha pittospori]|uniref:PhoD-like phosphatase N-terminal domain-containing protein n=1 Tax=Actinopolymorpha pittospori TaxID=648752 RepID=UPI001789E80E